MKAPLRLAMDVVQKTIRRRTKAAENPGSKSFVETVGFPKATFKIPQRIKATSHVKLENRETAEQRLKLKTGSFFIHKW